MKRKMSKSEAGKLGGIAQRKYAKEQKELRIKKYDKTPTVCKNCDKKLSYDKRKNKFCSKNCSVSYNNKNRGINPLCKNCNIELPKGNKKYCNGKCNQEYNFKQRIILIENGEYVSPRVLKRYLVYKFGYKCNNCGITEWDNKPITLELEHKDGNSTNNNLDNIELLCPNCHSQTPTYKSKNKGNGRHSRRKRYQDGKSY